LLSHENHVPAYLAPGQRPVLVVVVDTEEEFAWDQPFDRASTGTTAIAGQPLMHERVFDGFGIVPTYVIDYPVATEVASRATLRGLMEAGRCEIGAHLHPWVSPPHEEEVSRFNSFTGNLPRQLEFDKLRTLTEAITLGFGRQPTIFKAGRYGLGPHTAEALAALGYRVDASVVPYTSFATEDGPDFRAFNEHPYWFGAEEGNLLELPVTTGYSGWLRASGPQLYELAGHPWARVVRLGAVLARLRGLERIRLSPEVATLSEMQRLTRDLMSDGCQVYSMTYHSPSMVPGHTPYVRTGADLERFITTVRDYCAWFRNEMGGQFMTVSGLHAMMLAQRRDCRGASKVSLDVP
jgi:hypothetical protein